MGRVLLEIFRQSDPAYWRGFGVSQHDLSDLPRTSQHRRLPIAFEPMLHKLHSAYSFGWKVISRRLRMALAQSVSKPSARRLAKAASRTIRDATRPSGTNG